MDPSLTEIWPYTDGDYGMLGLRMGSGGFASGLIEQLLNNNGGCNQEQMNKDGSIVNGRKRRDNGSEDESSKKNLNGKRMKPSGSEEGNGSLKSGIVSAKPDEKKVDPLKDYIHVRARRGQATDSHSLAERARREKIGERMKVLQGLVPGTNKVTGKALVLDEIINYVQSLQRQVEFLSMKLETVNSGMIHTNSGFIAKDINQLGMPSLDSNGMMLSSQATRELGMAAAVAWGQQAEWLHMQLGGSVDRTS